MEPMSNLANIKPKLGCRLGEFGTPDSIHGARQSHWLDQLGSTKSSCLQEAQGSPSLPLSLARSYQCGSRSRALRLVTFTKPGSRVVNLVKETVSYPPETPGCREVTLEFLPPGNPWLCAAIDEL